MSAQILMHGKFLTLLLEIYMKYVSIYMKYVSIYMKYVSIYPRGARVQCTAFEGGKNVVHN